MSPDYVVVPEELEEQLIARVVKETQSMYPNITENEDYAGIINEMHFARLQNYIDDAVAKGAKLTIVGAEKTRASDSNRRMPLHILQNVNEDMLVMHAWYCYYESQYLLPQCYHCAQFQHERYLRKVI